MTVSSAELLDVARVWHQGLKSDAPSWDDIEVVVRLRVTLESVARQLLLEDTETLMGHWSELQQALAKVGTASAPGTPADEAPPSPGPEAPTPVAADSTPELSGAVLRRFRALMDWLEESRQAGKDVGDISEADLVMIAKADPKDVKRFKGWRQGLRNVADDMMGALRQTPSEPEEEAAEAASSEPDTTARAEPAKVAESTTPAPAKPGTRRTGTTAPLDFTGFDYAAAAEAPPVSPAAISFHATGEESLELSWPAPTEGGQVRIFSVVASNEYAPIASPALGDLIVSTFDNEAVDTREFTSPVRYVAIWVSRGASEQEARSAQPTLHAVGGCVLPVRDCVVREDEGTVIGSWEAIAGVARIDVLRVPLEQAERLAYYNDTFRIPASKVSSGGFTDDDAVPGASYEYRIYALAVLSEGEELSPPVARRVNLTATIEPVLDLEVTPTEGSENTFDLTWTAPALGDVEIYRSETPPASGIDASPLERSALQRQGLTQDLRLDRMRERAGNQVAMRNVPWPTGWSRAYFTPVTVLNDALTQVGRSRNLTRTGAASHVRLVERVDEQFLTFAWPAGAPVVKIYCGPAGSDRLDPAIEPPIQELSEDEYRRYGGAHLADPLPPEGCSVHVVATSYTGGQARYATPATVQYEGLARIQYQLVPDGEEKRGRNAPPTSLRRVLARSATSPTNLRFVLVNHRERLPLHPNDGVVLQSTVASFVADHPITLFEGVETAGLAGFLRVFAVLPRQHAHRVAVLDPSLSQLRLG